MTFLLHGTTLALAWFLAVNIALSALVALASLGAARGLRAHSGLAASPSLWFALRVLPAALSAAFVAAVFVPSYLKYEPRELVEGFDVTLTVLAAAGFGLIVAGACRAWAAWSRASRRADAWMNTARPLDLGGAPIPAYTIDAGAPVMALVGIVSPKLLVTRGLIDLLTPEELTATIAHELGHCSAWDNLKRLAMAAAPDVLGWTRAARVLERGWASAAEHRADRHASSAGATTRFALASALVKVARLMPSSSTIAEPISTLVGGGEIVSRVEHLIEIESGRDGPQTTPRLAVAGRWSAALATLFVLASTYAPLIARVHLVTEAVIRLVP